MFNKIKEKAKEGKAKIEEKKAERKEAKQNKWINEVTKDSGEFHPFSVWKDLYEPKKEKASEPRDPNAMQKKIFEKLADNMTANIVTGLCEALSKVVGAATEAVRGADPHLSAFLNAVDGALLTYRFEAKGKSKMVYLRGVAADRLAITLVSLIEARAVAEGADPEAIDPELLGRITAGIESMVREQISKHQGKFSDALRQSPLFAVDGAEEGVGMLMDFVRSYIDGKVTESMVVISQAVGVLAGVASKYRTVIKTAIAAGTLPEELPEDYRQGARAEIIAEIEKTHGQLSGAVRKYIVGLLDILAASSQDDGGAAEE